MALATHLARFFKWLFLGSLVVLAATAWNKDALPDPDFYAVDLLRDPVQGPSSLPEFTTRVNGQEYLVNPVYDYELQGVVVSFHDADALSDIWHHDKWGDFLNLRDLCVIWGKNVQSGVYQRMEFSNDSWTCWAYWPDRETGARFSMTQLSNNHLLADDETIIQTLSEAEIGDHIRLQGVLAAYSNPASGFQRGTSTSRTDTGNGACETVYLQDFEIVNKANPGVRTWYELAKWGTAISMIGYLLMFFLAPVKGPL